MFNTESNSATDQEMERLLELSTNPEFLSQLDSFKEKKANQIKAEYKDKITALENEIQNIRAELNAKLSALGVNIEKSPKRRSSKNNTRRTKEATQELLSRVKDLIRQNPGITAGEISAQVNSARIFCISFSRAVILSLYSALISAALFSLNEPN